MTVGAVRVRQIRITDAATRHRIKDKVTHANPLDIAHAVALLVAPDEPVRAHLTLRTHAPARRLVEGKVVRALVKRLADATAQLGIVHKVRWARGIVVWHAAAREVIDDITWCAFGCIAANARACLVVDHVRSFAGWRLVTGAPACGGVEVRAIGTRSDRIADIARLACAVIGVDVVTWRAFVVSDRADTSTVLEIQDHAAGTRHEGVADFVGALATCLVDLQAFVAYQTGAEGRDDGVVVANAIARGFCVGVARKAVDGNFVADAVIVVGVVAMAALG
jgi:hypothetical protein